MVTNNVGIANDVKQKPCKATAWFTSAWFEYPTPWRGLERFQVRKVAF